MHAFLSNLASRHIDRQTDKQTNTGKNMYLLLCRRYKKQRPITRCDGCLYNMLCMQSKLSAIAPAAGFLWSTDHIVIVRCSVYAKHPYIFQHCEDTPGIVSDHQLRWFWISWQDDVVQFGGGYRPGLNLIVNSSNDRVPSINSMSIASINNIRGFWIIPEVYYVSGKCVIMFFIA